jgi:hypothetical protein
LRLPAGKLAGILTYFRGKVNKNKPQRHKKHEEKLGADCTDCAEKYDHEFVLTD